ncbi:hypothetical protein [Mesorhizobium sp.]|nr:hypothetical protein [Mesorhizobium sp.]
MKHRTIVYTSDAGNDLDRIYNLIAEASSATTANRYSRTFVSSALSVA